MKSILARPWCLVLFCALCQAAPISPVHAEPPAARLSMIVLGSGGPGATGRAGAGYLVLLDNIPRILVDAGPGTFVRLGQAQQSVEQLDTVLLTHLHIDHTAELPGIFKARAVSSYGAIGFHVFGPAGRVGRAGDATFPSTTRLIHLLFDKDGAYGYLKDFSAPLTIDAHNLNATVRPNLMPETIVSEGALKITAIAGHHRDAPAVIYRIDYAGKSITFSGDIDAAGLPDLANIAAGTDLLVFNSVVLDPPGSPDILYTLHTPPRAIGQLARDARVGKLVLSHLSPAVDQARAEVEQSIRSAYHGPLIFAEDGLSVTP
jgi:ribonuclease BN (tRNA processing enzyme)